MTTPAPEDSRVLGPEFVWEQWRRTEERRRRQQKAMRKAKYAYESRLWKGESTDSSVQSSEDEGPVVGGDGQVLVEVSRMPGVIQTYTGHLFPRSPRTVFSPDVEGAGDPVKGQTTVNRWFSSQRIHRKLSTCISQALLYRGSCVKIGLDLSKARPQDRVWCKVVPWWDLVLDWDVQDVDEQRFMGHEYWEDVAVLEKRLGMKLDSETTLEYRVPFFDQTLTEGMTRQASALTATDKPESKRFVRVLEWYNFVDDFKVEGGGTIRGVFELYLVNTLNGGGERAPLFRKAMPFTHPNGEPCAPLFPLIFDYELEHPLRGIAFADRVYPQCYELALLRTAQANALRKEARIAFVNKTANADENLLAQVSAGKDGTIVPVDKQIGTPWDELWHPIGFGNMTTDHSMYAAAIENDLNQSSNAPKFTRGEGMGARTTAYEVRQLNQYMENRLGEMARTKDAWISEIARGFLRIMIMACKAPSIVGASKRTKPDPLIYLEGPKHERVVVEWQDLDGDFEIGVVDAASTPMTREARRADMAALLPNLLALWKEYEAGNPMAAVGLNSLVDLYDLSGEFNIKNLLVMAEQMRAEKERAGAEQKAKEKEVAQRIAQRIIAEKGARPEPASPMPPQAVPPTEAAGAPVAPAPPAGLPPGVPGPV